MALKLNQTSGMPDVSDAFADWKIPLTFVKITQENDRGDISEKRTNIKFDGSVQPLGSEELQKKPEGLRSYEWLQIHAFTNRNIDLVNNDRIEYNDKPYKVLQRKDHRLNGYIEYHIIEEDR